MLTDKKPSSNLIFLLILILFTHGQLYFFIIYDDSSMIKIIKYIVVFFIFAMYVNRNRFKLNSCYAILFVNLFIAYVLFAKLFYPIGSMELIVFIAPIILFVCSSLINRVDFNRILFLVMIVAMFYLFIEVTLMRYISKRFSSTGFRAISIFINPNAFGIFMVLLLSVTWDYSKEFAKWLSFVFVISCVLLSGSKTAMIMLALFVFMRLFFNIKGFLLTLICVLFLCVFIYGSEYDIRSFDLASGEMRASAGGHFFNVINECFFMPIACDKNVYLDNALIISWVNFGIIGFVFALLILFLTVYLSYANYKRGNKDFYVFFSLFWLASLTTNVLNIWPVTYMFWIMVGYSVESIGTYKNLREGRYLSKETQFNESFYSSRH